MSRSRLALGVLILTVAAATPAVAAKPRPKPKPKPLCKIVTDTAGDAHVLSSAGGDATYDPSLDIVSADIANDAKWLTAVIRVKDLTPASQVSPGGRRWSITFSNGTQSVGLVAHLSDTFKQQFSTGKGAFDFAKDEVRISIPMADLSYAKIGKGSVFRGFYITTNSVVAFDPAWGLGASFAPYGGSTDNVNSKAAYPAFALSCVRPGQ